MPYIPPKGAKRIAPVTITNQSITVVGASGGTTGAPVGAEYVVSSANTTLTNERVTTDTTEVLFDTQTPGQLKANVGAIAQSKVTGLTGALSTLTTAIAAKQSAIQVQDEGQNLGTSGGTTVLNFTGAGVTATNGSGTVTVTIAGGGLQPLDQIYGDGSDGDLIVTGAVSLTASNYYNNLTVTGTGNLNVFGARLHVNGTLTVQSGGKIQCDGLPGANNGAGSGLPAAGIIRGTSGAGSAGVFASSGGLNGNAATGNINDSAVNSTGVTAKGGNGGGVGSFTGGTGYTPGSSSFARKPSYFWQWGFAVKTIGNPFTGGGGGGSGASQGDLSGGGGGGASGMWIAARTVSNSGSITSNGGAGGNATTAVGPGAGGGGGGGGGIVWLITKTAPGSVGTVTANGGAGGTGFGNGLAGTAGTAGAVVIVQT